ncbi:MAG: hypothetical protein IKK85_09230 [Clostridia bacterium]|nr:hypothetical protein [Clostridia bacterium]
MLIPKNEAFYNARTRYYLNEKLEKIWLDTLICDKPIFNANSAELYSKPTAKAVYRSGHMVGNTFVREFNDWEIAAEKEKQQRRERGSTEENKERAARRAKAKVFELGICNPDMLVFATLTVAPETGIRTDYKALVKKLKDWLGNRVQRNGLKYIIVPEFHKNGAIHFHGLFNDRLQLIDSGTVLCPNYSKPIKKATAKKNNIPTEQQQTVYNIADYKLGFTTAMISTDRINGSQAAAAGYVTKYITKDMDKVGGRYYLSGGDLQRPICVYYNAEMYEAETTDEIKRSDFEICGLKWLKEKPKMY